MESTIENTQMKKHRSPSYPSIDLELAVQKVALLYQGIRKNSAHVGAAIETMNYKLGSSTGMRALAAMISYGLITEEGAGEQRMVRLTKPALDLQHLSQDDIDRVSILQQMALSPKIFEELFQRYSGQLPNDATIEKYLKVTRGFNPEAVRSLIRNFRSTYEFANLVSLGILSDDEDDNGIGQPSLDFQEGQIKTNATNLRQQPLDTSRSVPHQPSEHHTSGDSRNIKMTNQENMRTLTIPLPGERIAFLEVPAHSSADDFRFMLKYLELMKDAWVNHPNVQNSTRKAPSVRFGPAMWHGPETDSPVNVIGYWGELNGVHYVMIEGSETGIPFDQIEYDNEL